ncbi:unnamed protein product [Cyclocybe aegerita]|uniref:Uncharacterized protein n=1 Tax=Cyclocybe aegerita TaxID=1973307 RepID=A0A8S0X971_CYCAE|nr:unnamed protein product [Cyclocybe aegerita]
MWRKHLTLIAFVNHSSATNRQFRPFITFALDDESLSNKEKENVVKKWKVDNANPSLVQDVRPIDITSPSPLRTLLLEQPSTLLQPENVLMALVKSSLHQSLTTIFLTTPFLDKGYSNIPLSIFPVCSNLKDITFKTLGSRNFGWRPLSQRTSTFSPLKSSVCIFAIRIELSGIS